MINNETFWELGKCPKNVRRDVEGRFDIIRKGSEKMWTFLFFGYNGDGDELNTYSRCVATKIRGWLT